MSTLCPRAPRALDQREPFGGRWFGIWNVEPLTIVEIVRVWEGDP